MSGQVAVVCCGTRRNGKHDPWTLARYQWSAADGVWERVDQHGSNADWFIEKTPSGELVGYPTPRFKCQCGRDEQPRHDDLQRRIEAVRTEGQLVL